MHINAKINRIEVLSSINTNNNDGPNFVQWYQTKPIRRFQSQEEMCSVLNDSYIPFRTAYDLHNATATKKLFISLIGLVLEYTSNLLPIGANSIGSVQK